MKTRLLNVWESVQTSFWFVPTAMVVLSVGLSFLMVAIDRRYESGSYTVFGFTPAVGPEGARSLLSTIAGSMITVAGVTFSITIVTLTLASSQFGPRLLRNFMQDKGNQIVLGTFIATFIYCLLVLRSVHSAGEEVFVPDLAVNFGLVLALTNLGILIYFIHHVSASIQADRVVAAVYQDLEKHMQRLFPEAAERECRESSCDDTGDGSAEDNYDSTCDLVAPRSGYLQAIDIESLLTMAAENDALIRIHRRPGKFVVADEPLATVQSVSCCDEALAEVLVRAFIFGTQRTPEQDAEFTIDQLVEIAVRALSPGINDPFTAIACIDRLGAALCGLANRAFPSPYHYDSEGSLRVIAPAATFAGFANTAFDQIRQYGRASAPVTIHLLETLTTVARQAHRPEQGQAILRQATMIERGSAALPEECDREDAKQRYRALVEVLGAYEPSD